MNKKGFVLLETIISITIVTLSLTVILSTYFLVVRKSDEKERYDKPGDKYLLYSIANIAKENKPSFNINDYDPFLRINKSDCSNKVLGIFNNDSAVSTNACNIVFSNLDVKTLYIVKDAYALLYNSELINNFDNGTIEYLKTIKKIKEYSSSGQYNGVPIVNGNNSMVDYEEGMNYLIGVFYRNEKYYFASIEIE